MTDLRALATRVLELDGKATRGPWRIGHINEHLDRGEIENVEGTIVASDCKRSDEGFVCEIRMAGPTLAKAYLKAVEALHDLHRAAAEIIHARPNWKDHFAGLILAEQRARKALEDEG